MFSFPWGYYVKYLWFQLIIQLLSSIFSSTSLCCLSPLPYFVPLFSKPTFLTNNAYVNFHDYSCSHIFSQHDRTISPLPLLINLLTHVLLSQEFHMSSRRSRCWLSAIVTSYIILSLLKNTIQPLVAIQGRKIWAALLAPALLLGRTQKRKLKMNGVSRRHQPSLWL